MQPPLTGDTAERDYFTLREADHYAKTTGSETQKYITHKKMRASTRWATHAIIVST